MNGDGTRGRSGRRLGHAGRRPSRDDSAPAAGRVLVALTAATGVSESLDLCLHLLEQTPAELLGLRVEDASLLAHARSGLAREVALSGLERPLDPVRLDRQLRAQTAALRSAFERDAARLGLGHVFEVVRGDPLAELKRAALTADALLLDAAARARYRRGEWPEAALRELAATPLRRIAFAGEGWRLRTEIVVIAEQAPLAGPTGAALSAALGVARRTRSPLRVLLLAADDATAGSPPAEAARHGAARLPGDIERAAREARVRLEALTILPAGRGEAIAFAHARRARLTVLTPRQAAQTALVAELMLRGRGAVLVVRES
ncbi:MAG: hypothetical protein JXB36_00755 [Gammaproteobacteria bacterium]|nr:hypothetical protein [Gammaproteobacteria bacterium]